MLICREISNLWTPNNFKLKIQLTWKERIGYCSGELAQNLIYQTVSIWLLFYYTNVYGLKPELAAVMFFIVRIVDVLWDPFVGTLVDRSYPKWGKYRSWLIIGGIPLAGAAVLCFWNGFDSSLLYAYVTYVALSMCFTLTSVPYGALGDSLTRDVDELTVLTSVRMIFANVAGLLIKTLPLIIAIFAPKIYNPATGTTEAVYNTPEASSAWLITMSIFAIAGLALLIFCFSQTREKIVMSAKQSAGVKFIDLWKELTGNRPLRVLSIFFIITFATMSISNAADSYFLTYVAGANPLKTSTFMWLGTIPAFIFIPLVPAIKKRTGKNRLFYIFIGVSIIGMILMYVSATVPGLVLSWVGFNAGAASQTSLSLNGIIWLVTAIPAALMLVSAFVISRYELSDSRMAEINSIVESRHKQDQ